MSGKERRDGGVFGRQRVAQTLRITGMTAVEVLGSGDELIDGTVRSIDAATVAEFGPYRKSRLLKVSRLDRSARRCC